MYSEKLYVFWKPLLKYFDRGGAEESSEVVLKKHIVLVGAHRLGRHVVSSLQHLGVPLAIVDLNPEVVAEYNSRGIYAVCGDITESYIQEQVNLPAAKVVISTIPSLQDNLALLEAIKRKIPGSRGRPKLIFAAQSESEAKKLYEQEIDYALSPHFIGGQHLAKILRGRELGADLKRLRKEHLEVLGN